MLLVGALSDILVPQYQQDRAHHSCSVARRHMNEQSAIPRTRGSLKNLDYSHAILAASSIKVTGRMPYSVASIGPVTVGAGWLLDKKSLYSEADPRCLMLRLNHSDPEPERIAGSISCPICLARL